MSDRHMSTLELPVGSNPPALEFPHFPTRQQAVVWRNWELVTPERLAMVLRTNEANIIELARDMGLRVPPVVNEQWLQRGYITIIRANWHLLPYEQLLQLLGWTAERMAFALKEDDFLYHKLGRLKPRVDPVVYRPLSAAEKIETDRIRELVQHYFPDIQQPDPVARFAFLDTLQQPEQPAPVRGDVPQPEEIVINDSWTVVYPEHVKTFIDRFVSTLATRWGITLTKSTELVSGPSISLSIQPDEHLLSESHTIKIDPKGISITGVDEVGLLRGLQWIEQTMEQRGGPYLPKTCIKRKTRFDLRLIYPYFALYGDSSFDSLPDGLLSRLSKLGVNGIWLQGILYNLVPWDEAPELSTGWEKRIESLRKLVDQAADFGIGIYLYLNEPRAMPPEFFANHPDWRGSTWNKGTDDECISMCTSHPEVQNYLRNAVARLFSEVPKLAGVFTITMSENPTNCYSKSGTKTECPRCSKRTPEEVVAEVNKLIAEGAHSINPDARIIVWTWGWGEWAHRAIDLLPDDVSLMCVSEQGIPTHIGGINGSVIDYSMSIVGPGELAMGQWRRAISKGLPAVAKIQINNTWECSAVPYLPVMNLVNEHLNNLKAAGVTGLMLSWTLGGYPSPNLELVSAAIWEENDVSKDTSLDLYQLAERKFGPAAASGITEAWQVFSQAFREFPFHVGVAYLAPQNYGPMNILHAEPTGYQATMLGFPYDDLESWRSIYPEDVFEQQFRKLSEQWHHGLEILKRVRSFVREDRQENFDDLERVAISIYTHFKSTHLQIAFVRLRNQLHQTTDRAERRKILESIMDILTEEIELARTLYNIARFDSRIGYEATNQYYYTLQDLREKIINCEYLRRIYGKELQQDKRI